MQMKQKKNFRQIFSVFLTCMMIIGVALVNDHIFVEGEGKPQAEQQVQEGEPQQEPKQGQEPGQQEQGQGDSGKPGELPGKPEEVKLREEPKKVEVDITEFTVTNANGSVEPDGYIANQIFRLNCKWEVLDKAKILNEGDYFQLDLPTEFNFPEEEQYLKFDLLLENETTVVAKAVITRQDSGGGTIKVTFTDYVNGKQIKDGKMNLTARWQDIDSIVGSTEKNIKFGSATATIKLKPYIPPNYAQEVLYKTTGQTLTDKGWVRWRIRVNTNGSLKSAVVTDTLRVKAPGNLDGIEYVGKFMLHELELKNGKLVEKSGEDISDNIEFFNDKRSFKYDFGDLNGKRYILYYYTNYKQGLLLENTAVLNGKNSNGDDVGTVRAYGIFLDSQSGGGVNDDFNSRIKIIKFDGWDQTKTTKLKGAKFKITKKGTGDSIYVETDVNGEALTMPITPGEYTIKETEAPQHYMKDDQEYTVPVSSDKLTRINIGNAPETIDIKVRKEWIGFEKPSIKVVLYANKVKVEEHELTAPSWEYTFKNFRKYDQNTGTEIIYTVDEEVVPTGYERSITGSPKDEFVITNKQKTIDIKGEKTWDDNNNAENKRPESITVFLYANGHQIQNPEVRPDANGKWTYSFEGLQEYDSQGNKITYTIKEEPVPGYTSEVNGYNITNTYNPQNSGGGGSGGGQSGGGSGGTGGDDSNKPKPNDPKPNNPKPNNPTQNGPTPSDDSTGMGGATPPDSSVVSNDSTTSKNTVAPKNQKMPKSPVLTDKQGVKKTAQAGRRLPKTGEGANPTLYAWMLGALGSMLVLVGYRKRKTVK